MHRLSFAGAVAGPRGSDDAETFTRRLARKVGWDMSATCCAVPTGRWLSAVSQLEHQVAELERRLATLESAPPY